MDILAVILLGWNCTTSLLFGKIQQCKFNYLAFDEEHLGCLRNQKVVESIEGNLRSISRLKNTCPTYREPFPNAFKFAHLLNGKSYLSLSIDRHPLGGYIINTLFDKEPHGFTLWLYPIENQEFQLREVEPLRMPTKANRQMLAFAKESRYAQYWRVMKKRPYKK